MVCKKCNSNNVAIQAVSVSKRKRKGILYWLFIGWRLLVSLYRFVPGGRLFVLGDKVAGTGWRVYAPKGRGGRR